MDSSSPADSSLAPVSANAAVLRMEIAAPRIGGSVPAMDKSDLLGVEPMEVEDEFLDHEFGPEEPMMEEQPNHERRDLKMLQTHQFPKSVAWVNAYLNEVDSLPSRGEHAELLLVKRLLKAAGYCGPVPDSATAWGPSDSTIAHQVLERVTQNAVENREQENIWGTPLFTLGEDMPCHGDSQQLRDEKRVVLEIVSALLVHSISWETLRWEKYLKTLCDMLFELANHPVESFRVLAAHIFEKILCDLLMRSCNELRRCQEIVAALHTTWSSLLMDVNSAIVVKCLRVWDTLILDSRGKPVHTQEWLENINKLLMSPDVKVKVTALEVLRNAYIKWRQTELTDEKIRTHFRLIQPTVRFLAEEGLSSQSDEMVEVSCAVIELIDEAITCLEVELHKDLEDILFHYIVVSPSDLSATAAKCLINLLREGAIVQGTKQFYCYLAHAICTKVLDKKGPVEGETLTSVTSTVFEAFAHYADQFISDFAGMNQMFSDLDSMEEKQESDKKTEKGEEKEEDKEHKMRTPFLRQVLAHLVAHSVLFKATKIAGTPDPQKLARKDYKNLRALLELIKSDQMPQRITFMALSLVWAEVAVTVRSLVSVETSSSTGSASSLQAVVNLFSTTVLEILPQQLLWSLFITYKRDIVAGGREKLVREIQELLQSSRENNCEFLVLPLLQALSLELTAEVHTHKADLNQLKATAQEIGAKLKHWLGETCPTADDLKEVVISEAEESTSQYKIDMLEVVDAMELPSSH